MSEVSELLNDVVKQFNDKIKEIYDNKLLEHQRNISYDLSEDYTEGYGKIKIQKNIQGYNSNTYTKIDDTDYQDLDKIDEIINYLLTLNKSRYIIKILDFDQYDRGTTGMYSNVTYNYSRLIIDNYGDYIIYSMNSSADNYGNIRKIDNFNKDTYSISKPSKYILPNILIDIIKQFLSNSSSNGNFNGNIYINTLEKIRLCAEDYYKKFTKYKSLYSSGKLIDYEKLLLRIDDNTNKHNNKLENIQNEHQDQINNLNEIIAKKDELILTNTLKIEEINENNKKQIDELSNQIELLKNEIKNQNNIIKNDDEKKKLKLLNEQIVKSKIKVENELAEVKKEYNKLEKKYNELNRRLELIKNI